MGRRAGLIPPQGVSKTEEGRPIRFIGGWQEIGKAFGLSSRASRKWYDMGAPIIMVGKQPVAEVWELWCWLREEYG